MRLFTTILSAVALAAALFVGLRPIGPVPPLGQLISPTTGIWSVVRSAELPAEQSLELAGLSTSVDVRYDDRGVPHVFAQTEADAARALGWIHARDRLFQMEMIQRAVAGTLTELVGARALPLDRSARRLALAEGALAKWNAVPDTAVVKRDVTAYMNGVNAYIDAMRPQDLPLEYRLLGRRPRRFDPQDTYFLLIRMSQTLSFQQGELAHHAVSQLVGEAAADALFGVTAPIQEPIEPVAGRRAAQIDARWRLPAPVKPDSARVAMAQAIGQLAQSLTRGEAVIGSNNWAVAPQRSATGHALLAGDPHLELTLPSIWYEAHLVVPGQLDAYGVGFPLAPIIPIGFNRDMAWTMTNTGNDVVDFYKEVVDDSTSPRRYMLDGAWTDVRTRVETYRDPNGGTVAVDTFYATHRGPLFRSALGWVSQRWTAREPSNEGDNFRSGMRATGVRDFYARMESYHTPAQNMLTADRAGNIGIRSTGRYPIRPGNGRGDVAFDGSTRANDWTGDQPVSWYPQSINPAQGYLASANQQPMDPSVRPGYQGADWPSPWRAMRINALLRGDSSVTVDDMRRFHTDPRSELTPFVMRAVGEARAAAQAAGTWTNDDEAAFTHLSTGESEFTPTSAWAVLFNAVVTSLTRHTWDELIIPGEDRRIATPGQMLLVMLLRDPGNAWWDDRRTGDATETRDAIVLRALREAWTETRASQGNDPSQWRWGNVRQVNVHHLLRLPGFGRTGLEVTSGPGTLSPSESNGTHGASWRFVVELGPEVKGWGTYPGGQSGNPVSSRYADRMELWRRGELAELRFPRSADALPAEQVSAKLTFTPAGGSR
ncbi:penicillin acylase family protein [Pseudogemmatithrix spongiicola]|uniref:Penicillin acylase family protein n=1 Tax=Pseudogemmatithrix spongiicola TaxID=3062599 RepID=A0AA49Q887_9BACT|nr:penicillin acylase family protein [Gemmatimonadaceae bacterium 'strain 138']WKW14850.1 penicillin acylase family protein [Gemmatimonadaceae bacterium 'strain 318']